MILWMSYFHNGIFCREAIFIVTQVRQHDDKTTENTKKTALCIYNDLYVGYTVFRS